MFLYLLNCHDFNSCNTRNHLGLRQTDGWPRCDDGPESYGPNLVLVGVTARFGSMSHWPFPQPNRQAHRRLSWPMLPPISWLTEVCHTNMAAHWCPFEPTTKCRQTSGISQACLRPIQRWLPSSPWFVLSLLGALPGHHQIWAAHLSALTRGGFRYHAS